MALAAGAAAWQPAATMTTTVPSSAGSEPTEVAFALKPSGEKATLEGPSSVKAGLVHMTLKNSTEDGASVQLVRVEGDHSAEEVLKAGKAWGDKGKPLPDWLRLAGGVPNAPPGTGEESTQVLTPGKYVAADIEHRHQRRVRGDRRGRGRAAGPAARRSTRRSTASPSSGLKAGTAEVAFDNKGKQPHFVVGVPIKQGKTIEDVKKFFKDGEGRAADRARRQGRLRQPPCWTAATKQVLEART